MHLMVKRVKPPLQITLLGSHMMSYLSWKSSVLCQQYVFSHKWQSSVSSNPLGLGFFTTVCMDRVKRTVHL